MQRTSIVEKIRMGRYKRPVRNQLRNQTVDRSRIVPTHSIGDTKEEELYLGLSHRGGKMMFGNQRVS